MDCTSITLLRTALFCVSLAFAPRWLLLATALSALIPVNILGALLRPRNRDPRVGSPTSQPLCSHLAKPANSCCLRPFPRFPGGQRSRVQATLPRAVRGDQSERSLKRSRRELRHMRRGLGGKRRGQLTDWRPLWGIPEPAHAIPEASVRRAKDISWSPSLPPTGRKRNPSFHRATQSSSLNILEKPLAQLSSILASLEQLLQPSHHQPIPTMGEKSDSSESMPIATPPDTPVFAFTGVMPRPGQSGSLDVFTGKNASDYLDEFNVECELYRVKSSQRVLLFPHYCLAGVKDVIKDLPGYEEKDWEALQAGIRELYWADDRPRNTVAALNALIRTSASIPLAVYVLKFAAISERLVAKRALSEVDRFSKLLEGLDERMRNKVIKLCTQRSWRVTDQDTGESPRFEDIKSFLEAEAKAVERVAVYEREHVVRGPAPASASVAGTPPAPKASISPVTTAVSSPALDPIADLTNQLAALTLMIKSMGSTSTSSPAPTATMQAPVPPMASFRPPRTPRCVWCDSTEHARRECASFADSLKAGTVRLNEQNRVVLTRTDTELPTAYGRGGMKSLFDAFQPATTRSVNVNAISFSDGLGKSYPQTRIASAGPSGEWIDADVEIKRKRDGMDFAKNSRPRTQAPPNYNSQPSVPTSMPMPTSPPDNPSQSSDANTENSHTQQAPTEMDVDPANPVKPKYRLQSELGKTISTAEVGEKIMNAPIMFTIKEFLAVSPDMANYIHEQTRRKRHPIEADSTQTTVDANVQAASLSEFSKAYYALPSGRVAVVLNDQVRLHALLDSGSELNIMSEDCYRQLGHPIDEGIRWRINGFDSKIEQELDERYNLDGKAGVLGVLHNVNVDVGGVEVKQHIFVIKYLPAGLILGRPWERATRATFTNEDDGSYTVAIRAPDNMKEVKFMAMPSKHERNRDTVRPKD